MAEVSGTSSSAEPCQPSAIQNENGFLGMCARCDGFSDLGDARCALMAGCVSACGMIRAAASARSGQTVISTENVARADSHSDNENA